MKRTIVPLASLAVVFSAVSFADPGWTPVTVASLKSDAVKVFGPNCKGDTGQTIAKDDADKIAEAKLRPSGGCVRLIMKGADGQPDLANPKFVPEKMVDIPNKPAKPIVCPPGVTMTEKDKTSNTAMGLGGECVPAGTSTAK
jgi:hypothetical protein